MTVLKGISIFFVIMFMFRLLPSNASQLFKYQAFASVDNNELDETIKKS